MRKLVVIFLFLLINPAWAASVSSSPSNVPKRTSNPNLILNVQSGIKANQSTMKDAHFNNSVNSSITPKPIQPPTGGSTILPVPVVPFYSSGLYYYYNRPNETKQIDTSDNKTTIINNYIYNNEKKETEEKKAETKKELSQTEKDEKERQYLRKKYSSILSNTTQSNDKMCSSMEKYFKNADYEELDRVLNRILRLNCDIDKFRSF